MHGKSESYFAAVDEAAGIFEAGKRFHSGWALRATLFPAHRAGGLVVFSPVARLGGKVHEAIATWGEVRYLVAPNHFHHLGLREWQERYPAAEILATPEAANRIARQNGLQPAPIHGLAALLADDVRLLLPPGLKTGEMWFSLPATGGRALVVGDAFFSLPGPFPGLAGGLLRALGTGPGLRISRTWGWLHCREPRKYDRWFSQEMETSPPDVLIPCHGEITRGAPLRQQLAAIVTPT